MLDTRTATRVLLLGLVMMGAVPGAGARGDSPNPAEPRIGFGLWAVAAPSPDSSTESVPDLPPGLASPQSPVPGRALSNFVLVPADRDLIEHPERLEALFRDAAARGLEVAIRIRDPDWEDAAAWSARLQGFSKALGERPAAWQIFGPEAAGMEPRQYAYLLKYARVAIRAGGSYAPIVSPPLQDASIVWGEHLFAEDAAPYLDIIAAASMNDLQAVAGFRERVQPRAPLWVTEATASPDPARPADDPDGWSAGAARAADDALEALSKGAAVVLFAPLAPGAAASGGAPATVTPAPVLGQTLTFLRGLLFPGLRPSAAAVVPFDVAAASASDSGAPIVDLEVLPFFETESRTGLFVYRIRRPGPAAMHLPLRAPVTALDLSIPSRRETRTLSGPARPGAIAELPVDVDFLAVRFTLAQAALPLSEIAGVGAVAELTAEEVIARERETRGVQKARLDHYEAKAVIGIHYRLPLLNETIDLVTENRLYVKNGRQDYLQTALYVNGSLWRGKEPPHLPYLAPEKVGEVPLDIVLDESYRYRLEGRDKVDGIDCYVLSFEPIDATRSLYKGRVSIDARHFHRVKMEAIQTNLSDPVRSNEVVYRFGPVASPDGEVWLPQTVTGQMMFELLGYSLAVEREATYSDFQVNAEGYETRRAEATSSGRPLFRETEQGFYRLTTRDGQDYLQSLDSPKNTFLAFGFSGDETSVSFPFVGVNFFDFNFKGTGTQFNLAVLGPFADITWNQPNLFDSPGAKRPVTLALRANLNGLKAEEKLTTSVGTAREDRVDVLRETIFATLAVPMGDFLRGSAELRSVYQNFDRQHDTSDDFVLPPIDIETTLGARLEFARLGYLVAPWAEWGWRNVWAPWGLPGQKYSDDDRDFTRLGIELRKAYYLTQAQKVTLSLNGFEGRSLDRFSRFQLGDFRSARVQGFNDSGIHFDTGLIAETAYAFPLGKSMRADLSVQHGWISSTDDFGPGYERVTGSAIGLEMSGPWSTFVVVRANTPIASTIEGKSNHGGSLRVTFFKTFDKWSRTGGTGRSPVFPAPPPDVPAPPPGP